MDPPKKSKHLFANKIGGPMTFTFTNVLSIQKKEYVEIIQSNGGKVVDYNDRDRFTIVLTKKGKGASVKICFNLKYVKDCRDKNEVLPLENYRLNKSVDVACCYSEPLGSTSCLFAKLIRKRCRKHKIASGQKADRVDATCDEAALKNQLKFIKSQIHAKRLARVKLEMPEESMQESQEDQSFETETYCSESLLRRKAK